MILPDIIPVVAVLACLQFKHFVADGPLQTANMVRDKGYYGRPLGILHSGLHGAGTFLVLLAFASSVGVTLLLALLDFVIHYHVDFTKENVVRRAGWTFSNAKFWWALSADQLAHQWTYLLLAVLVLKAA